MTYAFKPTDTAHFRADITQYLAETPLLDFSHSAIQSLINEREWDIAPKGQATKSIYNFCRDEILFGYNFKGDTPKASEILAEGIGQCNTKATLFMALLRAIGVPCRTRGSVIKKRMQKEAIGFIPYLLAPSHIIHTWAEVFTGEKWLDAEGLIIDRQMLSSVQQINEGHNGQFDGYAISTSCLNAPTIEWNGDESTYIQSESIADDFGRYPDPDTFYDDYGVNLTGIRKWLYQSFFQPRMNKNVSRVRESSSTKNYPAASSKSEISYG